MNDGVSVERCWQANARYQILSRVWDDECVIYHSGSGNTHLLDLRAFEILELLQQQPATPERLAGSLASHWHIEENPELTQYVEKTLRDLYNINVIEPVSS